MRQTDKQSYGQTVMYDTLIIVSIEPMKTFTKLKRKSLRAPVKSGHHTTVQTFPPQIYHRPVVRAIHTAVNNGKATMIKL